RSVLELAAFVSSQDGDRESFSRYMAQLKPYLYELSTSLPASPNRFPILGLNLLYLLLENRLADFHSELELMTEEERGNPCIQFPIQLEQHLTVGSYDKVLEARSHVPHPQYKHFLASLLDTVREAIADCAEASYGSLAMTDAAKMMMFPSEADCRTYIAQARPDWQVRREHYGIVFKHPEPSRKASDIPSMRVITESLSYATELERIV
ncbi:unnamed protein product, partial [Chrysoparadoxa australica]